jgi:hypothetical protein
MKPRKRRKLLRAPSPDLKQTFKDAIADFNDAVNVGDYRNFRQYLYPINSVYIQKVDDPAGYIQGSPDDIINYLNADEAIFPKKLFPKLLYDENPPPDDMPHAKEHKSDTVGDVTGTGDYQDRYDDSTTIRVQYCLRFKKYGKNWLLVTALVAPI